MAAGATRRSSLRASRVFASSGIAGVDHEHANLDAFDLLVCNAFTDDTLVQITHNGEAGQTMLLEKEIPFQSCAHTSVAHLAAGDALLCDLKSGADGVFEVKATPPRGTKLVLSVGRRGPASMHAVFQSLAFPVARGSDKASVAVIDSVPSTRIAQEKVVLRQGAASQQELAFGKVFQIKEGSYIVEMLGGNESLRQDFHLQGGQEYVVLHTAADARRGLVLFPPEPVTHSGCRSLAFLGVSLLVAAFA